MDLNESAEVIVARVLEENDLDAEHALTVLVRTLVARHVDCELRKMGRRDAWTPGNERLNALTAAFDALYEAKCKIEEAAKRGEGNPSDEIEADVMRSLNQMLATCQFAGERKANIIDDDGEERPIMRLVTD
jgi:hypothetical protein